MKYNPEINRLRALAILPVLYQHTGFDGHLWRLLKKYINGDFGVDLFFVISGFVISATLDNAFQKNPNQINAVFSFWVKRITRIWPQALLWMAVLLPITYFISFTTHDFSMSARGALAAFLNIYDFFLVFSERATFYNFYWSLSLEEQFYLVLPFFLILIPNTRNRVWILLAILVLLNFLPSVAVVWLRAENMVLGVLWYEVWKRVTIKPPVLNKSYAAITIIMIISALGFIMSFLSFMPDQLVHFVISFTCLILVVLASLRMGILPETKYVSKALDWIGKRSYAIYLAHTQILNLFGTISLSYIVPAIGHEVIIYTISSLMALLVAFIAADVTYRFVESPLRRKGREYADAMQPFPQSHETA